MTKRGRGVSTRLKAISMTFKDGLITADDKNRLKDLLLLGDSSLEDALDGVLSGDRTKILGKSPPTCLCVRRAGAGSPAPRRGTFRPSAGSEASRTHANGCSEPVDLRCICPGCLGLRGACLPPRVAANAEM